MKVVLASHNAKKITEMRAILSQMGVEVLSQRDVGVDLEPEETGTTFEANARIKAKAVMEATGLPAIADDSGLMVDALDGAPGVYSARYGGPGLDDTGRWQLLLRNMAGQSHRTCRFVSVICCAFPDGSEILARGECPGVLAEGPSGAGGFGYDPIFFLPQLGKTMAQLTPEEKNQISHRANEALEARELIKCRVLESAMLTAREACQELAKRTRSEGVQVIGTKFVLYRESHSREKKDKIVLVKDRKKPTQT